MPSTTIIMGDQTPTLGRLIITRGTRPAPQAIRGIIIIPGMVTPITTRPTTITPDHRIRRRGRTGIRTSR